MTINISLNSSVSITEFKQILFRVHYRVLTPCDSAIHFLPLISRRGCWGLEPIPAAEDERQGSKVAKPPVFLT